MFRSNLIIILALLATTQALAGTTVPIVIVTPIAQPGDACIGAEVGSGELTTTAKGETVVAVRVHGANASRCPEPGFPNLATTKKLQPGEERPLMLTTVMPPHGPTEAQIQREYERMVAAAAPVREYHVRHILLRTRADALAALDRIRAGSAFADVAAELTIDGGSKKKGGDLGWNVPSSFIEEFSKSMVSLAPSGLVAEPVQTRFGWHVIEVLETKVGKESFPPLAIVKARIVARLEAANRPANAVARVAAKVVCRNIVAPVLPASGPASRAKGTVIAEFRVEKGAVAEILKLSGPSELYPAVRDAVNKLQCDRLDQATIAVQSFDF